jgi:hypothetical protein
MTIVYAAGMDFGVIAALPFDTDGDGLAHRSPLITAA